MKVSIIIRMRNEASYLRSTLGSLASQEFPEGFEIVIADNCSTDNSVQIAKEYTDKIITVEDYTPGKVLNMAIEYAGGDYIAILSAHTIPANSHWLRHLFSYMNIPNLGGVYGAQLYSLNSKFLDKRDLDIFSTLSPRVEIHDTDFWNANSMFPRSVWKQQPFDEKVFELEDHYWTKLLTPKGFRFYFEPEALVYHYSHIDRIDREHLPFSSVENIARIDQAMQVLNDLDSDWPSLMRAGLTLSSLTDVPYIHQATIAIGERLIRDKDFDVRWRMAQALGKIPNSDSVRYLIQALNDSSFYPRDEAAWSLARLGKIAVSPLLQRADDFPPDKAVFAALSLGRSSVPEAEEKAVKILNKLLETDDVFQLCDVVYFAGEIAKASPSRYLIEPISNLLNKTKHPRLTMICCWALGEFGQYFGDYVDWNTIQQHISADIFILARFEAIVALGKRATVSGDPFQLIPIIKCLEDASSRIRFGAIQSIRCFMDVNPKAHIPQLINIINMHDDDNGVLYELSLIRDLLEQRRYSNGRAPEHFQS